MKSPKVSEANTTKHIAKQGASLSVEIVKPFVLKNESQVKVEQRFLSHAFCKGEKPTVFLLFVNFGAEPDERRCAVFCKDERPIVSKSWFFFISFHCIILLTKYQLENTDRLHANLLLLGRAVQVEGSLSLMSTYS